MSSFSFLINGAGLGIAMSALLALVYSGKTFEEVRFAELLATPILILLTPPVLGLLVATVALKLRDAKEKAITTSFVVGALLGGLAALLVFGLTPFPGHGFFFHLLNGVLFGGALGSMTPYITFRLDR